MRERETERVKPLGREGREVMGGVEGKEIAEVDLVGAENRTALSGGRHWVYRKLSAVRNGEEKGDGGLVIQKRV